jgi:hypothetical protein
VVAAEEEEERAQTKAGVGVKAQEGTEARKRVEMEAEE